ncbi:MAG: hypothetical protein NVS3B10_29530 [Polyangiales bacterium]
MRGVLTDKRPCRLERGELRRVPQDRTYRGIVGYYVGCPACGFVTAVLQGVEYQTITESAEGEVTFSTAARCVFCNIPIRLVAGELTLEEGIDVRLARYR